MPKYSPSINILRDSSNDFEYIPTANAKSVVSSIDVNFKFGKHSFVVIGSYGTGKSSLLWAIEQSLTTKNKIYSFKNLPSKKIEFLNVVGSYQSIVEGFGDHLGVKNSLKGNQLILDKVHQHYESTGKDGMLVIMVDEMGKFLEYASDHQSKSDLYFLQQLAELANNPKENILLITTLHQNFDAYSGGLSEVDKNEWAKVHGRFEFIAFNEPVEQLLMLASESLSASNSPGDKKIINQLISLNESHKAVSIKKEYIQDIGAKLYPLDIFSATILTLSLQKYGQNERSLFSFLNSKELAAFKSKKSKSFFSISELYDYLWENFYSFLNSKSNPHHNTWSDARDKIEKIENLGLTNSLELISIVKTIGLFQIFQTKGGKINEEFISTYLLITEGIKNIPAHLTRLHQEDIVKFKRYDQSYRIVQGTDIDIEEALAKASDKVDKIINVADALAKHFGTLDPVLAKRVSLETGTPRLFNYEITEIPIAEKSSNDFDGTINLVLRREIKEADVKVLSAETPSVIYALFRTADKIKEQLFEIEKSQKVISENSSDKVAVKELNSIIQSHKNLLNHYLIDEIYGKDVIWISNGQRIKLSNKRQLNGQLSAIAQLLYPDVPIFRNELINRNKVSTAVSIARNELFKMVVNEWEHENLKFDDNFPPEKMIYLTLLRETGIHQLGMDGFHFGTPNNPTFLALWEFCREFLNESKEEKKRISELFELLAEEPFGLKLGFIQTWVPLYLFMHRDDFALYGENGYIPEINELTMQLFIRNTDEYSIKAFNLRGVNLNLFNKYRELLNQSPQAKPTNESFIESIRPFLVFYKQLPDYTRNTSKLSREAKAVREAIVNAKDPEETFFDAFPKAFGVSVKELNNSPKLLTEYTASLKEKITELRSAFDELINRFEGTVIDELGFKTADFKQYKESLVERYKKVKPHLLLNYQKTFLQRVNTSLDDRNSWLSSLAQVLLQKPLENFKDEDEKVLHTKFKAILHELDNLVEIAGVKHDSEKERVFKFEITSDKTFEKSLVKIPKTKFAKLDELEKTLKKGLKDDKQLNIAALTKLLQEELKK